jgi:hypothetical protein
MLQAGQQIIQKMFYSQYVDGPNKINEASNGGFLFSHNYSSSSIPFSSSFTRLDTSLNILWTKEFVLPSYKTFLWYHKEITPDTFVAWGKISDSSNTVINTFLIKIDGNVITSKMSLRRAGEAGNNAKTNENSIQAYPNPSAGVFKLHHDFMPIAAHKITKLDTFGKTIFQNQTLTTLRIKLIYQISLVTIM